MASYSRIPTSILIHTTPEYVLYPPSLLIESSKHVLLQAWQADRTRGHNYLPASIFAVSPCPLHCLPIILTTSSDSDMIKVSSEVSNKPSLQTQS